MAKTEAVLVERKNLSPLDVLTHVKPTAEPVARAVAPLSQAEFVQKVTGNYPVLIPEDRAASPDALPIPIPDSLRNHWQSATRYFDVVDNKDPAFPVLDCTHWLEVMDERHRYGSLLRPYYDVWRSVGAPGHFFEWLDYGEGRGVDLGNSGYRSRKFVSRDQLERSCVRYCTEKEREQYRAVIRDGVLVWASVSNPGGGPMYSRVDTNFEPKWIFVIDLRGNLYINRKKKGGFHHSSFVAGQPVRAAGRIAVDDGLVACIGPNSGHYRTKWEQLLSAADGFFGECLNVIPPFICPTHETNCIRVVRRDRSM